MNCLLLFHFWCKEEFLDEVDSLLDIMESFKRIHKCSCYFCSFLTANVTLSTGFVLTIYNIVTIFFVRNFITFLQKNKIKLNHVNIVLLYVMCIYCVDK